MKPVVSETRLGKLRVGTKRVSVAEVSTSWGPTYDVTVYHAGRILYMTRAEVRELAAALDAFLEHDNT